MYENVESNVFKEKAFDGEISNNSPNDIFVINVYEAL